MWKKKDTIAKLIKKIEKFESPQRSVSRAEELRAAIERKIQKAA